MIAPGTYAPLTEGQIYYTNNELIHNLRQSLALLVTLRYPDDLGCRDNKAKLHIE